MRGVGEEEEEDEDAAVSDSWGRRFSGMMGRSAGFRFHIMVVGSSNKRVTSARRSVSRSRVVNYPEVDISSMKTFICLIFERDLFF